MGLEANDTIFGLVIFILGFFTGYIFKRIHEQTKSRAELAAEESSSEATVAAKEETVSKSKRERLASIRARGLGRDQKMVFVVRTDLGMGKGKIAAQCSHAAVECYQEARVKDPENLDLWEANGVKKICLKFGGDEEGLEELEAQAQDLGIVTALICDAGHTQVI
jgi:peptidyl-tRNA hydrolase